jgi:hypothetical protein
MYLQHTPNHTNDAQYSLEELKQALASLNMECHTVLAPGQPTGITVFLRRVRKLLARSLGKSLAMSRPMKETHVLVATKGSSKSA